MARRKRYPSDDDRLKAEPHIRVAHSIRNTPPEHARWSEVFDDPLLRGTWLGLVLTVDEIARAKGQRVEDGVRITPAHRLWITARPPRRSAELIERVCLAMGYEIESVGGRSGVQIVRARNAEPNQGWDSAFRRGVSALRSGVHAEPVLEADEQDPAGIPQQNRESDSADRGAQRTPEPDQRSGFWLKEPEPLVVDVVLAPVVAPPPVTSWRAAAERMEAKARAAEADRSIAGTGPLQADLGSGSRKQAFRRPTLRDLRLEDLRDPRRVALLYPEAVEIGLAEGSTAGREHFFATREHALRKGSDPVRLFISNLRGRRRYWHADDLVAACRTLRELEEAGPLPASVEDLVKNLAGRR